MTEQRHDVTVEYDVWGNDHPDPFSGRTCRGRILAAAACSCGETFDSGQAAVDHAIAHK